MSLRHQPRMKITALTLSCCLSLNLSADPTGPDRSLQTSLNYDLLLADIPRQQAPIASVALAKLQIALYQAKTRTEQQLCNGNWSPRGKTLSQSGPEFTVHSDTRNKNWHYRSLRQPHPLACPRVTRAQFFMEMSRHLPKWVVIKPAGQLTAFSQGHIHIIQATSVASR